MVITYPYKSGLYVNLTNRCPCACTFCLRQYAAGVAGSGSLWLEHEPSLEEVVGDIDARNLDEFDELVFCGYGEPTERLEVLLDAARHVKALRPGMKVRVNTNGLSDLINGEPTAQRFKGTVDTVSISLNASTPAEYLRICCPKFGLVSWQAMMDFSRSCLIYVPDVVMTVVGAPVTSPQEQLKCKEIAEGMGARLRVRPCESGDAVPHSTRR